MERNEVQKLHIMMSIRQYSIILSIIIVLTLSSYLGVDYPNYLIKIIFSILGLSLILRFLTDIIYRKSIFVEDFAIKIFIDYFIRIIFIAFSVIVIF